MSLLSGDVINCSLSLLVLHDRLIVHLSLGSAQSNTSVAVVVVVVVVSVVVAATVNTCYWLSTHLPQTNTK